MTTTPETLLAEALEVAARADLLDIGLELADDEPDFFPREALAILAHAPLRDALVRGLGMTEERLAAAIVTTTPRKEHGQLCPVWTRRHESASDSPHSKKSRSGLVVCDCFIARDARHNAPAILAALAPEEPDAADR